jgi:serine/threonine-protein kinase
MKSWQAGLALGVLGLRYREEQADSSDEKGKIFRQDPTEGARVPKGTEITIYISAGGPEGGNDYVTVPGVTGRSWDDAKTIVQHAGLVFELRRGDSPEHSNIVQRQSPESGSKVPRGSKVTVFID